VRYRSSSSDTSLANVLEKWNIIGEESILTIELPQLNNGELLHKSVLETVLSYSKYFPMGGTLDMTSIPQEGPIALMKATAQLQVDIKIPAISRVVADGGFHDLRSVYEPRKQTQSGRERGVPWLMKKRGVGSAIRGPKTIRIYETSLPPTNSISTHLQDDIVADCHHFVVLCCLHRGYARRLSLFSSSLSL
jgi:hypothetical protein